MSEANASRIRKLSIDSGVILLQRIPQNDKYLAASLTIYMLLYWGMFTVGFLFGSILAFVTFAPKKPEEDAEYETPSTKTAVWDQSAAFEAKNTAAESIFPKQGEKTSEQNTLFAKKDPKSYEISLTN